MNNKLNTSAKALIACDLINDVVKLFGDTFLVAYFLQVSNENIIQVSLYYIIVYALLGMGHILLGKNLKKHIKGRINIYRIGVIVKSIFVLLMVLLKNNIQSYYIGIAIFYGISEALYWSAHGLMNIEVVENSSRQKYTVISRILSKTLSVILPIILGTTIELTSFTNIAIYVFALTIIQITMSFLIDSNKFDSQGKSEKYSLKKFIKSLSGSQKEKVKNITRLAFLYGLMMDTIRVLIVVITIMTFKTSIDLGILTTLFSICSMFSLFLFNRFYNKKHAKGLLSYCAIVALIGVIGLLINISKETLVIYNFTYSITVYILEIMYKINLGNIVNENNIQQWLVEYHTILEAVMDIGRIVGFLLLLITGLLNNIIYFKILLLVVTISIPLYAIIMYNLETTSNKG
ncbi:MAG: hypothetical protein HFJ58_03450 [Clostridia bacterium]|nr:hypothetical protein [Clostridia bacterium]